MNANYGSIAVSSALMFVGSAILLAGSAITESVSAENILGSLGLPVLVVALLVWLVSASKLRRSHG